MTKPPRQGTCAWRLTHVATIAALVMVPAIATAAPALPQTAKWVLLVDLKSDTPTVISVSPADLTCEDDPVSKKTFMQQLDDVCRGVDTADIKKVYERLKCFTGKNTQRW